MASAVDQLLDDLLSSDEEDDNHIPSASAAREQHPDTTAQSGDAHRLVGAICSW